MCFRERQVWNTSITTDQKKRPHAIAVVFFLEFHFKGAA